VTGGPVEFGVFARSFPVGTPESVAGSIRAAGFTCTQLNLSVLGRPALDEGLDDAEARRIRAAFERNGVRIWGVSGTFNAVHPDADRRRASIRGCRAVIARAPALGAEVVTLSTGTRDPDDTWAWHPDNARPEAWTDLRHTLDDLLPHAAAAGIRLGVEPERGNVVADAALARRLLRELGDDARHVVIVLDPANLLTVETLDSQRQILTDAFDSLGEHVAALHAKDVTPSGFGAPGSGGMDYALVAELHLRLPRPVPVIAQDLAADEAPGVHRFLERRWCGTP
jgi:sugar phosphate isomerase/epimerase